MPSPFLTAEWKNLIMANYAIDPAVLEPLLPAKTELDFFEGKVFLSLVGFLFANTRLLGVKIPFHVNFEEVNLRFYVRYNDTGTWKRGTVFIKEIVPRPAICFIANTLYHEKYCSRKMRHFCRENENEMELGYHWKQGENWNRLEARAGIPALPMQPGSEAEFIAEHYWGYSKYNEYTTFEYNVQHPAWNMFPVHDYRIDCDFGAEYGNAFSVLQNATPNSVFVAQGSAISVMKKREL